ncbi:MAG: CRISPR-associated endonuclease Cas2 [Deltaproteobacteria bacterium]|nr:CRISPR-associated endonuclease Cas2 [Deltaproteobacteria bacterium]
MSRFFHPDKKLYVVCYDISDNRRRRRLDKLLKGFGRRVQESVFECDLDTVRLAMIKNGCEAVIDHELDSIRIYRLCHICREIVDVIGTGIMPVRTEAIKIV